MLQRGNGNAGSVGTGMPGITRKPSVATINDQTIRYWNNIRI